MNSLARYIRYETNAAIEVFVLGRHTSVTFRGAISDREEGDPSTITLR